MVIQTSDSGFKQTELGNIPVDWCYYKFEDVMMGFSSGQTPSRAKPEYYKGDIPWITSGELDYNVITDTLEKITPEAARNTNLKVIPKGTFLFAITGLEAEGTRGSCAITGIPATTNQSCMALYPKKGVLTTEYLFHFYVGFGKRLALKYCQGTKQQSYTGGTARFLPIILPPTIEEQSAIVEVLSDADALITSIDKLIKKKKNMKQGAMQGLLTGKKRLPGKWIKNCDQTFTEIGMVPKDWKVRKVGETLAIRHGKSQHKIASDNGRYPILATGGEIGRTNEYLYDKPSVLIGRKGTIDKPQYVTSPFWTVDTLFYTEVFDGFSPKFLFYKFNTINWYSYNEASGVPSLSARTIEGIQTSVPSTLDEQKAIAQVLSDMDSEIEGLEEKRKKWKHLKVGTMQQLLTGRIRLKWKN